MKFSKRILVSILLVSSDDDHILELTKMTSQYCFKRNMSVYGVQNKRNSRKCFIFSTTVGTFSVFAVIGLTMIYFMDDSAVGEKLRKLVKFSKLHEVEGDLYNFVPVKVLSKKEIENEDLSPDAYLFLTKPKVLTAKSAYPELEENLAQLESFTKKKNLKNFVTNSVNLEEKSLNEKNTEESDATSESESEETSTTEPIEEDDDLFDKLDEIVNNEELTEELAAEVASEILEELKTGNSEDLLTEDGKSFTVEENFDKDESENVVVTSTFTTDDDVVEFEIESTTPSIKNRRYIENGNNLIDSKPFISPEKFFNSIRAKFQKEFEKVSVQKATEDVNVYKFLTTIATPVETNDVEVMNEVVTTPVDDVEGTTFDPRFNFEVTTEDLPTETETTTVVNATEEEEIVTTEAPTTTTTPIKPKKVKNSMDHLNFFKDFTDEDIEVLKSLFRHSKKAPRRSKEKRSHPENLAYPSDEDFATEEPETTTPEDSEETTTALPVASYDVVQEPLHNKRAAQNLFSSDSKLPKFNLGGTANNLLSKLGAQNQNKGLLGEFEKNNAAKLSTFANMDTQKVNFLDTLERNKEAKKPGWVEKLESETSEERENRIEGDLQKMIKLVGILSKVDGFLMDRTKSAVRKLGTLLDEDDSGSQQRRKRRNHFYY